MISVMMRIDDVTDRLIGDRADYPHYAFEVSLEFVID